MQLSVVIPCYNEEKNIPHIVAKLKALLRDLPKDKCEILLVDNGSTDGSANVFIETLKDVEENIRVIKVNQNKGYGYGILYGLAQAKGEFMAWTHADLQTDPADVFKALDIFLLAPKQPMIVKGYRRNRKLSEAFFSWGMGLISSVFLKVRLTEINAQPKLFHRNFYEAIVKDAPHDFSLDLYFLFKAKKQGLILDFPVFFLPRLYGEAKGGSGSSLKTRIKLIKRTLKYIGELSRKVKG
ncbi:MAG: glycosyltransferase family 2 protein [bacterium]|nr:glycosyltransferase family 2 protein [bacterium]